MVLYSEIIAVNPNFNPNLNHPDPLDPILANLAPIQVHANPPANPVGAAAPAAAQAAHHLAQQLPALAAVAPPAQLPAQLGDQNTPPMQPAPLLQPPGAPRRFRPRVQVFQAVQFDRGENLFRQFNLGQARAQPHTAQSDESSQLHFSPPSVCKPGLKRPGRDADSDDSPGTGTRPGLRI